VWNKAASINLQILPHFWETWWFRTLDGAGLGGRRDRIVRYISHRELRRQLQQLNTSGDIEQDRARIARDIHDHIGSGLTRINLLNELLLGEPREHLVGTLTKSPASL